MKIGLLPLYIAIYDIHSRHVRPRLHAFYETMAKRLEDEGFEVVRTKDFCCLKPQFEEAVKLFEAEHADAIVTLHMAYSPSLESIDALCTTELPVILMDTTETLTFTPEQSPSEIMYNHGIHGVMDLASMLKRRGKPYAIAAGHHEKSNVVKEVAGFVRAAVAAKALSSEKVGLFGGAFPSMGDFMVPAEELKERFGISLKDFPAEMIPDDAEKVSEEAIDAEIALDKTRFEFPADLDEAGYRRATAVRLGLRERIRKEGLTAFSVNFLSVKEMPFIECCKALERGTGYAGEGDGLTAAFTGAFLQAYPETNFVEIFCPDWENGSVFLSHMGEVNYRIVDSKPLVSHKGGFVDTFVANARMQGGKGVYVNVSRGPEDFEFLIVPAEMQTLSHDNFPNSIRGFLKPENGMSTAEFLRALSENGATHHSIFIYGASAAEMRFFADLLHMKATVL